MPFPIYSHSSVSTFTGSESPLSEGGLWSTYSGWPSNAVKSSGVLKGSTVSQYWVALLTTTYSDFEMILDITTYAAASDYIEFQTRVASSPTLATWNGYRFVVEAGANTEINRMVNGSSAAFVATGTAPAWATGNKIGIQSVGTTLGIWRHDGSSWANVIEGTDSTYTSGLSAIGAYSNVYEFDNLTIGTPAVVATSQSFQLLGIS